MAITDSCILCHLPGPERHYNPNKVQYVCDSHRPAFRWLREFISRATPQRPGYYDRVMIALDVADRVPESERDRAITKAMRCAADALRQIGHNPNADAAGDSVVALDALRDMSALLSGEC